MAEPVVSRRGELQTRTGDTGEQLKEHWEELLNLTLYPLWRQNLKFDSLDFLTCTLSVTRRARRVHVADRGWL